MSNVIGGKLVQFKHRFFLCLVSVRDSVRCPCDVILSDTPAMASAKIIVEGRRIRNVHITKTHLYSDKLLTA